nr:hypothetical protein HmN_000300600 [Hymenolepis microstoma]
MTVLEFLERLQRSKKMSKKRDPDYCRFIFSKASKSGLKKTKIRYVTESFSEKCKIIDYADKLSSIKFGQAKLSPQIYIDAHSSTTNNPNSLDEIEKQFPILSALLDEEDDWIPPSKRKKTTSTHEEEEKA